MESLREFRRRVCNVNHPEHYRINNSLGVYDAYKWIRKNKWFNIGRPLKEKEFYSIIRSVNQYLCDYIASGEEVILPQKMGIISIRKRLRNIRIDEDGKIYSNLPVDWESTIKLWYEDKEAYESKTLVRVDEKEIFRIYYDKVKANYNNKSFYEFSFNKDLKVKLKQKIKEGVVDAPLLNVKEKLKW
jgi:hypothetical protein